MTPFSNLIVESSDPGSQVTTVLERYALAVDAEALGRLLCLSLRSIRRADKNGTIPRPVRIGKAVRWLLDGPNVIGAWIFAKCPLRHEFEAGKRGEVHE